MSTPFDEAEEQEAFQGFQERNEKPVYTEETTGTFSNNMFTQEKTINAWSPKNKLLAGLLGIFLGVFGIHNFYLGFNKKAVTQLLITVLSLGLLSWVSAIWGLIEGILILASATGTQWDLDSDGLPMMPIGN